MCKIWLLVYKIFKYKILLNFGSDYFNTIVNIKKFLLKYEN